MSFLLNQKYKIRKIKTIIPLRKKYTRVKCKNRALANQVTSDNGFAPAVLHK
jgi:hypothetical protein